MRIFIDDEETEYLTEDILGDLGFRVVWVIKPYVARMKIYDVHSFCPDTGKKYFDRIDWESLPDNVEDISEAEIYAEGQVKWDGCTEIDWGQPHWCGEFCYIKHIRLIEYIYKRASELMGNADFTMDDWQKALDNQGG